MASPNLLSEIGHQGISGNVLSFLSLADMSKLSWPRYPDHRWHLIVAIVPLEQTADFGSGHVAALLSLLRPFLRLLSTMGHYALRTDRTSSSPEIHIALENAEDADRLARAVQARETTRFDGWATQHVFVLDEKQQSDIAEALKRFFGEDFFLKKSDEAASRRRRTADAVDPYGYTVGFKKMGARPEQ